MKKDPADYIRHIHDCILRIEVYVQGCQRGLKII